MFSLKIWGPDISGGLDFAHPRYVVVSLLCVAIIVVVVRCRMCRNKIVTLLLGSIEAEVAVAASVGSCRSAISDHTLVIANYELRTVASIRCEY